MGGDVRSRGHGAAAASRYEPRVLVSADAAGAEAKRGSGVRLRFIATFVFAAVTMALTYSSMAYLDAHSQPLQRFQEDLEPHAFLQTRPAVVDRPASSLGHDSARGVAEAQASEPETAHAQLVPKRPVVLDRAATSPGKDGLGGATAESVEVVAKRRHELQQDPGLPAGPEVEAKARSGNFTVVKCSTTAGPLTIHVFRDWAPHGAERFLDMVRSGFFSTKVGLFRAVKGFLCQTGVAGDPAVQEAWNKKGTIEDDEQWLDLSVPRAMKRGYLSFAGSGKNSRGVEFFFAFRDLGLGKSRWEVPFGTLVGKESFETMDHWYTGYGDIKAFGGRAPEQQELYRRGVAYLESDFPELDYILSCEASPGSTSA